MFFIIARMSESFFPSILASMSQSISSSLEVPQSIFSGGLVVVVVDGFAVFVLVGFYLFSLAFPFFPLPAGSQLAQPPHVFIFQSRHMRKEPTATR